MKNSAFLKVNKSIWLLAISLVIMVPEVSNAQFTLFGNAGYYKPNGGDIGNAMNTAFGFQAGALFTFYKQKISVGAEFGMQKYKSLDSYFGSGYISEMHIKNVLLIAQYHFYRNKNVSIYAGLDAGIGHYDYLWSDTLKFGTDSKSGITIAPNIGANMDLAQSRLALYVEIRYQITSTGDLNYGNYFSASHFDAIGISLGLKFNLFGVINHIKKK